MAMPTCGDHTCNGTEDPITCPADCPNMDRLLYGQCYPGDRCSGEVDCQQVSFTQPGTGTLGGYLCTETCGPVACTMGGVCLVDAAHNSFCYKPCSTDADCTGTTRCVAVPMSSPAVSVCAPRGTGPLAVCGNGTCEWGESCASCAADCCRSAYEDCVLPQECTGGTQCLQIPFVPAGAMNAGYLCTASCTTSCPSTATCVVDPHSGAGLCYAACPHGTGCPGNTTCGGIMTSSGTVQVCIPPGS
jgi:hypothetical protein